jgi:hypothetical protein
VCNHFLQIPHDLKIRTDIGSTAKMLYAEIVYRLNGEREPATYAELAAEIGVTRRQVERAVGRLADKKILVLTDHTIGNKGILPDEDVAETPQVHPQVPVESGTGAPTGAGPTPTGAGCPYLLSKKKKRARSEKPKTDHQALTVHFCDTWGRHYNGTYAFKRGKDGAAIKAVLTACGGDLAEAKRRVDAYFAADDPWYGKHGHELAFLLSGINRFAARVSAPTHDTTCNIPVLRSLQERWPTDFDESPKELARVLDNVRIGTLRLSQIENALAECDGAELRARLNGYTQTVKIGGLN